jgi:hypothetical protein
MFRKYICEPSLPRVVANLKVYNIIDLVKHSWLTACIGFAISGVSGCLDVDEVTEKRIF